MTTRTVTADQARKELSDLLGAALHANARFEIQRHGKTAGYLIGPEDMKLFEKLEEMYDNMEADAALAELERGEDETVPWEDAKKELYAEMTYEEFLSEAKANGFEQVGFELHDAQKGITLRVWDFSKLMKKEHPDFRRFLDMTIADRDKIAQKGER
ncbi:MAG: type II toxin-antitoxin system Phd/YefM family antitoxin [bacterium]